MNDGLPFGVLAAVVGLALTTRGRGRKKDGRRTR
jgi:hypothetical protein